MSKTILAVDDSEVFRAQLKASLEKSGFKILEASDGKKALEIINLPSTQIDLIITDYNMPEMNGLTLCEEINKLSKKFSIIMLSTEARLDLKKRGRELGVIAWAIKPVEYDKLVIAIKKILLEKV